MNKKALDLKVVVLAGGAAPGLWPESRELLPWQFQKPESGGRITAYSPFAAGDDAGPLSPFEKTARFAETLVSRDSILVLADKEQVYGAAFRQLRDYKVICEPDYRDTAVSLELACMWSLNESYRSALLVLPAGFVPENESVFEFSLQTALDRAARGEIAVIGFRPDASRAHKGYVVRSGDAEGSFFSAVFSAERPAGKTEYHAYEKVMVFKPEVVLEELKREIPELYAELNNIAGADFSKHGIKTVSLEKHYGKLSARSFGAEVLGRSGSLVCVPCPMRFTACLDWPSSYAALPKDGSGNSFRGPVVDCGSRNSLVRASCRTVGVVGLEDMAVIETADAVFVAPLAKAGEAAAMANRFRAGKDKLYREHNRIERPWGAFTILHQAQGFKVKLIEVFPGERLSLQSHSRREEFWTIIAGECEVTSGDSVVSKKRGGTMHVPRGMRHALKNTGTVPVQMIEIMSGDYLEEDDTVRFADLYGREDDMKGGMFS
ncbi:MAG: cupin domain-containing protein [Elusimicrobiaceae bacterium]|nr:cupin domain-containing protein [Elusimicrobiaceae bacterium]